MGVQASVNLPITCLEVEVRLFSLRRCLCGIVVLILTGTGVLPAQDQADSPDARCSAFKSQFRSASFRDVVFTYNEVTDRREVSSKDASLLSSVVWEPALFAEATGRSGTFGAVALRYKHTQVIMRASDQMRPLLRQDSKFYFLADTTRLVLEARPESYEVTTDPPIGTLWGYFKETLIFPMDSAALRTLAGARTLRMQVGDEVVRFDANRIIRGARALLLGSLCGWPN